MRLPFISGGLSRFFLSSRCIEANRRLDQIREGYQSIMGAFGLHDDCVIQQSIQQYCGYHRIAEHCDPFSKASIRGQSLGAYFDSVADQLKRTD